MPDYRLMYCELMSAVEHAVEILITAQKECAWIYSDSPEVQARVAELRGEKSNPEDEG